MIVLMAATTGLAVASNYYAQPLLQLIASNLRVSVHSTGMLVTTAQLGYALGLVLLVPLGDLLERRKLIVGMLLLTATGLLISAISSHLITLMIGTAIAGLFAVVAQILVPLGATMAAPNERGKVVGQIMSGLLMGILLARTAAGILSQWGGWRVIYWLAAGLLLMLAAILWRRLPADRPTAGLRYPQLLASIAQLLMQHAGLRLRALLGAVSFAAFSVLWTSLALLLSAAPYHYNAATIGLFGLAGAASTLAASLVGKWADQGGDGSATTWGLFGLLVSWVLLALGGQSLWALILGILVLDFAVGAVHVTNQNVIYREHAASRNRVTSGYMTCYFIGGAIGSLASSQAFQYAGWSGVVAVGAIICLLGLVVWLAYRHIEHIPELARHQI